MRMCVCNARSIGMYALTVRLLRNFALFGEREEDLLRGWLGNGAFEVGRDVDGAVWTVYLFEGAGISSESFGCACVYTNPLDIVQDFVLGSR